MIPRFLLGVALAVAPLAVVAQDAWPSRPIRLISTSVAGGNIDVMCRIIAEKLSSRLGQPVVVDNRPGAATVLGTAEAAKAPPDGYTFLITIMSSMVGNRVLRANLPYDPVRDFEPVTQISTGSVLLVGPANAPYRDLKGFVEWAKKLGRPVSYGSIGVGTSLHLFGVILEKEYGVPLNHVPYKGEVQATNDVMNGSLDVAWVSILIAKPLAASGKIQALAITGPKRFVAWPELPTFAEQGFPGFEMPVWGGAYLPAGTPRPIVERLSREIVDVLRTPEVAEKLIAMGQVPIGNTPAEFAENYRRDFPRWKALIRASGAKVE
jgi:tripartite-type tricarboxylate transporter receptor subunit TctC